MEELLVIGNEYFSIGFSPIDGSIRIIRNEVTQDNYIKNAKEERGHLFRVICRGLMDDKYEVCLKPLRLNNSSIEEVDGSQRLNLSFGSLWGDGFEYRVEVKCRITAYQEDPQCYFDMAIRNLEKREWVIEEVIYPNVCGIYLGLNFTDDILVYPDHAGERILNPIAEYPRGSLGYPHGPIDIFQTDGVYYRELNYCGSASMMWLDYYDIENGLYLASYDDTFPTTGIHVETAGPADPWMGFFFRKYVAIRRGQTWQSRPFVIGVHTGDWHWGADRYREWAESILRKPNIPEWFQDCPALWVHYDFRSQSGSVRHKFPDIADLWQRAKREDIHHLFLAGWSTGGFDTFYPEYYPDLLLGTPEDLRQACAQVESDGGHITFYMNSRLFNTKSHYYGPLGKQWACKDKTNSLAQKKFGSWATKDSETNIVKERYGSEEFAVMCPKVCGYQKLMRDWSIWTADVFRAHGVYLDQIGSAPPQLCFDRQHKHAHAGEFTQGYLEMLESISSGFESRSPIPVIMIEGCGDCYGQYATAHLAWEGVPRLGMEYSFPQLFKYTMPNYILVEMIYPAADELRESRFGAKDILHRAVLNGSVLWVSDETYVDQAFWEYFKKVLALRRKANSLIINGRFMDSIGLRFNEQSYEASSFVSAAENKYLRLVIVWNKAAKDEDELIVRRLGKGAVRVTQWSLNGEEKDIIAEATDTEITIKAMKDCLSMYVIEEDR